MPITPAQLRQVAQLCDDYGVVVFCVSAAYPAFTVTIDGDDLPAGCADVTTGDWTDAYHQPTRQHRALTGTLDGVRIQTFEYRDAPMAEERVA
jgi:hypothetical protein